MRSNGPLPQVHTLSMLIFLPNCILLNFHHNSNESRLTGYIHIMQDGNFQILSLLFYHYHGYVILHLLYDFVLTIIITFAGMNNSIILYICILFNVFGALFLSQCFSFHTHLLSFLADFSLLLSFVHNIVVFRAANSN